MSRRNRSVEYLLFLIPLFIIAFSVGYTVKRWKSSSQHVSDPGAIASKETFEQFKKPGETAPRKWMENREIAAVAEKSAPAAHEDPGNSEPIAYGTFVRESEVALSPRECDAIEFTGKGPKHTQISSSDWAAVMDVYHDAKVDLTAWLEKNKPAFASDLYELMKREVDELRIQRAPAAEEPDLAYRGIVVLSRYPNGRPLVRVGGGFAELVKKNRARARFDMTRVVAQAWSPCELQKNGVVHPWTPLSHCLGVKTESCDTGTYSEAGWAISSAVAAQVYSPGCTIPAFQDRELARCVLSMPLQRTASRLDSADAAEYAKR